MLPEVKIHVTEKGEKYALFDQPEVISDEIKRNGFWNMVGLDACEKILAKTDHGRVLDIGAGIGAFTVPLATQFRDKFIFACFEPIPELHSQLCANILLNQIEHAKTYNYVISNKNEVIDAPVLKIKETNNHGSYSFSQEINTLRGMASSSENDVFQSKTIDSFRFANVVLIKISTPGMEYEVLDGARETIKMNNFPPVMFEAWTDDWYADKRAKVLDFFASCGYEHYLNLGQHMVAYKTMSQYNHFTLPENEIEKIASFKIIEQEHNTKSVLESQKGLLPT